MTTANDIETEAMQWLVRLEALDSGASGIQHEFDAWCASDARRHATYIRLKSAWRKADQLKRLAARDGSIDLDLLAPPKLRRSSFGWRPALAASVAVAVVGAATWLVLDGLSAETYATRVGGFQRIVLSDGSTVELDTDSKVRVRFDAGRRSIELVKGQANFRVAQDPARPFAVRAGDATVRALGTAFSVRLRDRTRVEVLVTEGRVAVVSKDIQQKTAAAGEAVLVSQRGHAVKASTAEPADMARQLSWIHGRLTLEGETLREAVAEFNRYNQRKLIIADAAIEDIRVGGSFQPTDPQSFVTALERSFGVAARDAGEDIELTRAGE